jgi:hypothetical protein
MNTTDLTKWNGGWPRIYTPLLTATAITSKHLLGLEEGQRKERTQVREGEGGRAGVRKCVHCNREWGVRGWSEKVVSVRMKFMDGPLC